MGEQYDLLKYKKSIAYSTHLEVILNVIELALKALTYYKGYTSVNKIMRVMENEKAILQSHLELCKKIKESKGKTNE